MKFSAMASFRNQNIHYGFSRDTHEVWPLTLFPLQMWTCCLHYSARTEVQGWVSRLGGGDVQREVFGISVVEDCEPSILIFLQNGTYWYQECGTFRWVVSVPVEVIQHNVIIVTVQNRNLSFCHTQGWRILLNLLLVTILLLTLHPCLKME